MNNLKLQLSYGAYDASVVELIDEELGYSLVHKLRDALLELLALHGIIILYILEKLWREAGKAAEMQVLTLCQRVAYLEYAVVGQAHYVAGISLIDGALALSHELSGR